MGGNYGPIAKDNVPRQRRAMKLAGMVADMFSYLRSILAGKDAGS